MENQRIIAFNILKITTKRILRSLEERNSNLLDDLRDLLEGIPSISDEEREGIATVDGFWNILVEKEVISKDNVQVLKQVAIARFVNSKELEKEVERYEYENSGISGTAKLVIKTGLSVTIGLAVLGFCGENETAKQVILEKLVLPPLVKLVEVCEGSVCFVIETSSLASLKQLWTSYKDGSLKEKLKKVINEIEEVRKLTKGKEIDVTVEIDEEEYREACWVLLLAEIEQGEVEHESSKSVPRPRRHSSCEQDFLPNRDKNRLSWPKWRALVEELRQEIKVLKSTKNQSKKEETYVQECFVVGDARPDVGREMKAGEKMQTGDEKRQAGEKSAFARLPGAKIEARIVGNLLNTSPLIGSQATKNEVVKRLQKHLAVIHIAAMGNERGDIILAPSKEQGLDIPEEHDYVLTIEEIQKIRVRANLVVLSYSSRDERKPIGKFISISQAFLAAGARLVIAISSLGDEATLNFMMSFYKFLKMGEGPRESVKKAQEDIKEEEENKDPKCKVACLIIGAGR